MTTIDSEIVRLSEELRARVSLLNETVGQLAKLGATVDFDRQMVSSIQHNPYEQLTVRIKRYY